MPVTYTNRRGVTYYLRRTKTASGKTRYAFAREPGGESVDGLPEGYVVRESANGVVSLVKVHPSAIRPEEVAAVDAILRKNPKAEDYRIEARDKEIAIHEREGASTEELTGLMSLLGRTSPARMADLKAWRAQRARYSQVMRFVLTDVDQRTFSAYRMFYRGGMDRWIPVGKSGAIDAVARALVLPLRPNVPAHHAQDVPQKGEKFRIPFQRSARIPGIRYPGAGASA